MRERAQKEDILVALTIRGEHHKRARPKIPTMPLVVGMLVEVDTIAAVTNIARRHAAPSNAFLDCGAASVPSRPYGLALLPVLVQNVAGSPCGWPRLSEVFLCPGRQPPAPGWAWHNNCSHLD